MANSKINSSSTCIGTWDGTEFKGTAFIWSKTVMFMGTAYSGTGGMNQYHVIISSLPSDYRPPDGRRILGLADNSQQYRFQMTADGKLQALEAIPANLAITIMGAWDY